MGIRPALRGVCYNPAREVDVKLTEIREAEALTDVRAEWSALAERAPGSTVYQTWEWNEAWWGAFGPGKQLRLLMVHDGPDLVGLAPLYRARHLGTPLRRLAFLGTGASDYLDVLALPGAERAVCAAICRRLAEWRDYDLVSLQQMDARSAILAHVADPPVAGLNGHRVQIDQLEVCPFVRLPSCWEDYLRSLGKKTRSNVTYYERLTARELPETSIAMVDESGLQDGMSALFDLHQRRWRSRWMPGALGTAAVQRFHRQIAERFAERGWLRLHAARSEGRIIAALYCFAYRSRYYYYLGGFDPTLSRYSLGTTLTAAAIRQAIAEQCTEFDFLRGKEAYKQRWKPDERTNLHCLIAKPGDWRSRAMLRLNAMERRIERKAKELSDRGVRPGKRSAPRSDNGRQTI